MLAEIREYLPLLIPLIALDLSLKVISIRVLLKHPEEVKGNRVVWLAVVLLIQTLGPVIFLTLGRERQ